MRLSFNNYHMLKIDGHPITLDNGGGGIFSEMQFMYFANDYQYGIGIPNAIASSPMGTYGLRYGNDLSKVNMGSECYLTGANDYTSLEMTIPSSVLEDMKALNNTYTFFCKVYASENEGTGGVFSWRLESGGYQYMIRTDSGYLQIHGSWGQNVIPLVDGHILKISVTGDSVEVTDLDDGTNGSAYIDYSRDMGSIMNTFSAGYDDENGLDKMYAIAGINRATTSDEDEQIRTAMHNQSI